MRLIALCAALALATPALAQEAQAPPKPTVESLAAENAQLRAQLQAVLERRNALLIEAVNAADAARAQAILAAQAPKDPPK